MSTCPIDSRVIRPIRFVAGQCQMLDQRLLPAEEVWHSYKTYEEVAEAIRTMVVRGAPAIGVAAAIGVWFGARDIETESSWDFFQQLKEVCDVLFYSNTRFMNKGYLRKTRLVFMNILIN